MYHNCMMRTSFFLLDDKPKYISIGLGTTGAQKMTKGICVMGRQFHFRNIKKNLQLDAVDGFTEVPVYLMPLYA